MKERDKLEIARLVVASIDGTITAEEFARLDESIRADSDAADYYTELMLLYTGLHQPGRGSACFSSRDCPAQPQFDMQLWSELNAYEQIAEAVEVESPDSMPAEYLTGLAPVAKIEHRVSRLAVYTSILSAAALLLLVLFVHLNPNTPAPVVGTVLETVDAKWHHSSISLEKGQDIRAGKSELKWGLIRVRFDSGADVVVEGPAQINFLTPNSMVLHEGKIFARVGREASGFLVHTPCGTVRDIGTEFGVHVQPTGQAQVHVFEGEVHLYPDNASQFVPLYGGDARAFSAAGPLRSIPFQSIAFVRHEEMQARAESRENCYQRWKAAVYELHRDPSLVAHYFHAQDPANPDVLVNAAPTAERKTDGRFGTDGRRMPQWVQGRWPQKDAVLFERGRDQSIMIEPDRSLSINGPLSISTWVYYPNPQQMGGHLISCREGAHVNYQFSFFDDKYVYAGQVNRFEFLRYSDRDLGAYSRPFVQEPGKWHHFAAVYDGETVRFYADGKLFDRRDYNMAVSSRDALIIIGGMKLNGRYVYPEGDFDGIVDELMIFSRCLSELEIQNIYASGMPDPS